MSLYNMIHGFNPLAGPLLDSLKLYPPSQNIERFRDAALYNKDRAEDDYLIRVTTRTGDESYQGNKKLAQHEHYLSEERDSFDHTYRYFYFKVPPKFQEHIRVLKEKHPKEFLLVVDNKSIKEKTDEALEAMK